MVWAHKWRTTKINAENIKIKITLMDMSSAFVGQDRLLQISKTVVGEDKYRIICFFLSNTVLNIKVNKVTEQKPFSSNTGTPQGNSLSPDLFIIYLEYALKDVRMNIDIEKILPRQIAYADDVDFIKLEFVQTLSAKSSQTSQTLCKC